MNFLAHFHLAHDNEGSRFGALLGDYIRGTPASLQSQFPPEVIAGIMHHRRIDRFTDDHPIFQTTTGLLSPLRRRFRGIAVDIFFDHLLIQHWSSYSSRDLDEFVEEIHATLTQPREWITPPLRQLIAALIDDRWLLTNRTLSGLALTFRRVSTRRPFLKPLVGAEDDLRIHFDAYESAFAGFYPDLVKFASAKPQI